MEYNSIRFYVWGRRMGEVKRSYDSARRRRQAEDTRKRLAASARRLFFENGYAATTIESIAREAGVSAQTFYAVHGSKRRVLCALVDEVEKEADLPGLRRLLRENEGHPRVQLRHVVDFNTRLFEAAGDVLQVLHDARDADADLSLVWREGEGRRRAGQAPLIGAWASAGALGPLVKKREAADILWALTGPDVFRLFVREQSWSVRRYRDWLLSSLERLLFDS